MIGKNLTTTREKLGVILDERAKKLKKTAKELGKGTITMEEALMSIYQNDCDDYNDYVQSLRVPEKEEFFEETSETISMESDDFWQRFIGELTDATLTSLVISTPKIAEICQTLPEMRFAAVLNLMPPEKAFRLFCNSDDEQKKEVVKYIEIKALKDLFSCVCTFEYDEQTDFLAELDRLVELKTRSDGEEVSENEEIVDDTYSTKISFATDEKVLAAIDALAVTEQAVLIRKMPQKWIDPILDQVNNSDIRELLRCLSDETIKLMLQCNQEHFEELFRGMAAMKGFFTWRDFPITDRFEFLKLVKARKLQVKDVFEISDLVDVYCKCNEEGQEFVLYEVLADFEQEDSAKTENYETFEAGVRAYFDHDEVPVADELMFLRFLVMQHKQSNIEEIFDLSELVRVYCKVAAEDKEFILNEVLAKMEQDQDDEIENYKFFESAVRDYFRGTVHTDDEVRFLQFLVQQKKELHIEYIFNLDALVRVFEQATKEDKEFILYEILPFLKNEKSELIQVYKSFYEKIPEICKIKFLELYYNKAKNELLSETMSSPVAVIIMRMMNDIEEMSTTENVFLQLFEEMIPKAER